MHALTNGSIPSNSSGTSRRQPVWSKNSNSSFYHKLQSGSCSLVGLPSSALSSILPLDVSSHSKVERAMSWKKLLAYITGSVDQELLLRNEYLVTENRLLRKRIPGRVRLSDGERTTLAEIGKRLGKQALAEVATIVKPETILAWHRKLVAQKFDGSQQRKAPGRPQVDPELEALVVRLAQENSSWGYDRIVGALAHLGYTISDQTVGNILKRHGIPSAPERKKTTTWKEFIRTHMDVLVATDFFTAEVWTTAGLVTYYVLFFIHLASWRAGKSMSPASRPIPISAG